MLKINLLAFICLTCSIAIHAQDSCHTALPISAGMHTITAVDGDSIGLPSCFSANVPANAEWYIYTPTSDFTIEISTQLPQNAGLDTEVSLLSGTCGSLVCLAGNDDYGGNYLSFLSYAVTAGQTYYIVWDNRWSSRGFDFTLTERPFVAPAIRFVPQTIAASSNICNITDMNGDYLDDIISINGGNLTILRQEASGGFTTLSYTVPGSTTNPSWSIASGDFDANGYNDLVLGGGSRLALVKANVDGTAYSSIEYPEYIFTQRTNFVDIDNDGHLDLFACHDVDQSHAYRNDGAGNLILDIPFFPTLDVGGNYQSMWSDYDNDGDVDMYLAKCRGGAPVGDAQRINLLYRNNGDGTYTEVGAVAGVNDGAQSWSTAIEDFDNDGDMDFLLSNISDQNRFYRNNGDGTFTDIYATTGIAPQVGSWEVQAHDFNNDGWVDFLWQNSSELYLNNGDGTFSPFDLPFSEGAVGDLNNDGFLDVQMGNQFYRNTPNANNWIKINLQGVQSNRNGIGARVEIYGAWGKQIREIRSGSGFSHQSTLNAHFGIGTANQITKIRVLWPSGIVDEIINPTINQATMVVEGSTVTNVEKADNQVISFSPNPSNDFVSITGIELDKINNLQVYSSSGIMVRNFQPTSLQISLKDLPSGQYFFTINCLDGAKKIGKVIKL